MYQTDKLINTDNSDWQTSYQLSLLIWSPNPGVSVIVSLSLTPFSSITEKRGKFSNIVMKFHRHSKHADSWLAVLSSGQSGLDSGLNGLGSVYSHSTSIHPGAQNMGNPVMDQQPTHGEEYSNLLHATEMEVITSTDFIDHQAWAKTSLAFFTIAHTYIN